MKTFIFRCLAVGLIWFGLVMNARAQSPQIIKVVKGQTADIWTGVNVKGDLHLAVRTRDGRNRINLWWITWGVGSTKEVGMWGPDGRLDIPVSWLKGVVSAKLRGAADQDTIIYLSEKSEIDKSFTFNW